MSIVSTAKKCLNRVRYVFGANNINTDGSGMSDCSAFTQWVYKQNGINIGRTTQAQYSHGTSVGKNELTPGDLIFFKDTYDSRYKDGVSHVGIYVGNGEFIHNSSGAGKVVISKLNSAYYTSHYLGAKHISDKDGDSLDDDNDSDDAKESVADKDLTFVGDLIVVIMTVLLIGLCVYFAMQAFGIKIPSLNPIKGVKDGIS